MKSKLIGGLIALFLIVIVQSGFAQSTFSDDNYKFKIKLGSDWSKTKTEETNKKDAISYSYDKKDGKNAIMIIAFKVDNIKNLEDLVYTLEKDATLNIPAKSGDYTNTDKGTYEIRKAKYKDNEFIENIYFYRTKYEDKQNYAYMLRFITSAASYSTKVEDEIAAIAASFAPVE
ncbi:hypothetical protein BH10BAC5_BH10BAC5_28370 [soil metagenome]